MLQIKLRLWKPDCGEISYSSFLIQEDSGEDKAACYGRRLPRYLQLTAFGRVPSAMMIQRRCFSSTPLTLAKRRQVAIQRKKANIARQGVLQAERSPADFDPIVGKATEFTRALLTPNVVWSSNSQAVDSLYFPKQEMSEIHSAVDKAVQAREKLKQTYSPFSRRDHSVNPALPRMNPVKQTEEELVQQHLQDLTVENDHKSVASSRIVALQNSNTRTLRAYNTAFAIREFGRKEGDTGSAEVQAAVLTVRILSEAQHIAANKKDVHGFKGFRGLVHQRQKILKYLRRESVERYQDCIERLGLSDQCVVREITM